MVGTHIPRRLGFITQVVRYATINRNEIDGNAIRYLWLGIIDRPGFSRRRMAVYPIL